MGLNAMVKGIVDREAHLMAAGDQESQEPTRDLGYIPPRSWPCDQLPHRPCLLIPTTS